MKIFITGSSGFVGSYVKNVFQQVEQFDLVTSQSDGVDIILDFASNSSVAQSITNPVDVITNNTECVLQTLEYARRVKPKSYILFSTVEAAQCDNPYAASKRAQEAIVASYAKTYGFGATIVRASNVIGKGQAEEKFVPKLIKLIGEGKEVPIYTDGKGEPGVRDYVAVKTIAEALQRICFEANMYGWVEKYSLSHLGERYNNLKMASMIARLMNKPVICKMIRAEVERPGYTQELRESADFEPYGHFAAVVPVEEAVQEMLP